MEETVVGIATSYTLRIPSINRRISSKFKFYRKLFFLEILPGTRVMLVLPFKNGTNNPRKRIRQHNGEICGSLSLKLVS